MNIQLTPPTSPRKGAQPLQIFGPCILWPNGRPSQLLMSSGIRMTREIFTTKLCTVRRVSQQHRDRIVTTDYCDVTTLHA